MDVKKHNFDSGAAAALLRAAMETDIKPEIAEEYAHYIFNIFNIDCEDSYEKLLEMLQDETNMELLAEAINDSENPEELFGFARVFLGNKPHKTGTETAQKVFVENADEGQDDGELILFTDFNSDMNVEFPDTRRNKKGTLHILDCDVKTQTLSDLQCFQYIGVPEEPFWKLEDDFKVAEHLKVLSEINANDEVCGKLMLICESKYTGLIASKYLSGLVSQMYEDEEDEECEISFTNKLPVINASQIDSYMQQGINNSPIFSGGFGFQSIQNVNNPVPWWMRYEEVPLVVLVDKDRYLSTEFPNKLKTLGETHSSIIVIFEKEEEDGAQDIKKPEVELFSTDLNAVAEEISFKLAYNTYRINEPEITSEYMKKVFRDTAYVNNYIIDESVNLDEVLKLLKKCRGNGWEGNSSIAQLIKKAISLKKNKNFGILTHEDFAFLEHSLVVVKNKGIEKKKQEKRTESAVQRMNRCIFGLDHVKQKILEIVNVLKAGQAREKAGLKAGRINNVVAFYGPPGVGKTEMAQYFMEIMFENNLLPGKRFININGAQLKGAYVGHTAPKVANIFENHDVIFIDEAYSLAAKDFSMDVFSQEALSELCIQLEKHAKTKLIIFAGYGGDVSEKDNKMKDFLESNPGIASRVTFHVDFPSYSPENEMPMIFKTMVYNMDYILEDGWEDITIEFFKEMKKRESFGNAREARKLFDHVKLVQSSRLGSKVGDIDTLKVINDIDSLKLITVEDIRRAIKNITDSEIKVNQVKESRVIGF